jgi:hypothetical protein
MGSLPTVPGAEPGTGRSPAGKREVAAMSRSSLALLLAVGVLAVLALSPAGALVFTDQAGRWPADWPRELEPYREHAQTIGIATGLQMDIYQITFATPDEFEQAWPAILKVKSKGGTLTLYQVGSDPPTWPSCSNDAPCVRIYAPSGGVVSFEPPPQGADAAGPRKELTAEDLQKLIEAGKALQAAPPWPKSAYLPTGELPEYVTKGEVDGRRTWVPASTEGELRGFLHRARVDIELVVDGKIVDLNRVHIPANTSIIDKRGLPDGEPEQPAAP